MNDNYELLLKAMIYYGIDEEYANKFVPKNKSANKYAWCSLFLNHIAKDSGYEHTDSPLARSWLDIKQIIKYPTMGDIVILQRGKESWMGHVGIFINQHKDYIYILSGNDGDTVKINKFNKDKVLGYRRLQKLNK